MLEDSCYLLDIKIAISNAISDKVINHIEFDIYVQKQIRIQKSEHVIEDCNEKINLIQDAIAANMIRNPEKEDDIRKVYERRMEYLIRKKDQKVKSILAKQGLKKKKNAVLFIKFDKFQTHTYSFQNQ